MEYIFICPKCASTYRHSNSEGPRICSDCQIETFYSGYNSDDWYGMKGPQRNETKKKLLQDCHADLTVERSPTKTSNFTCDLEDGRLFSLVGARGRHLDVYKDKCVITTDVTLGSLITHNATDGEKTIYYKDCIGLQHKRPGLTLGYIQIETASTTMNNEASNFFNENSFTYDDKLTSVQINAVLTYVKSRLDTYKSLPHEILSPADELLKFKQLLDIGGITAEEYEAKKKELLNL